jgi:regulator of RNase E activity RraA
VSAPTGIINAVYGGLMSNRAKVAGAVGTIVDGRIRDLQEHRELEYPVRARSRSFAVYDLCYIIF